MKGQLSTPEQLLFNTIRIEAILPNGSKYFGTGFIFYFIKHDYIYLYLITNKHVINNSTVGILTFTKSEEDKPSLGNIYEYEMADFEKNGLNTLMKILILQYYL